MTASDWNDSIMPGAAYDLMQRFWALQDDRDYTVLTDMFAEDAVLEDPTFGRYEGRDAIAGFLARMSGEMAARGISFDLIELHGDDTVAWAAWVARTPAGARPGCGVYRIADGRIAYYRDLMDPVVPA